MNKIIGKTITIIALIISVVYLSCNIAVGVWLIDIHLDELGAFVLVTGTTLPIFSFFLFAGFGEIVDVASKYKAKYLTENTEGPVIRNMSGNVCSEGQDTETSSNSDRNAIPVASSFHAAPWTCPKCGAEIAGNQDVCMQCGTMKPQTEAVHIPTDWYCKKCGTLNDKTSKFCINCGTQNT